MYGTEELKVMYIGLLLSPLSSQQTCDISQEDMVKLPANQVSVLNSDLNLPLLSANTLATVLSLKPPYHIFKCTSCFICTVLGIWEMKDGFMIRSW